MGPPQSTAQSGAAEFWEYNSLGPIESSTFVSGNSPLAVGSTTVSQQSCLINLTLKNDLVVAANYRSRGKLLTPSLPCYSMLHACVPNPAAAARQPENTSGAGPSEKTSQAVSSCNELAKDPRLDPIRKLIPLQGAPTLEMQSNPHFITVAERPAIEVLKTAVEQCRAKIAAANPRLWQILEKINPHPSDNLNALYQGKMTMGEFNTVAQHRQDELKAALAASAK